MERESASLPAAVPETEGLTALIQKADEWKAKAAALAAQKAPLKKMREVLHMGLRMPVEVPQVEALRAEIRRREWEDTARKVSSVPESTHRVQGFVYGMHKACGTVRFAHGFACSGFVSTNLRCTSHMHSQLCPYLSRCIGVLCMLISRCTHGAEVHIPHAVLLAHANSFELCLSFKQMASEMLTLLLQRCILPVQAILAASLIVPNSRDRL